MKSNPIYVCVYVHNSYILFFFFSLKLLLLYDRVVVEMGIFFSAQQSNMIKTALLFALLVFFCNNVHLKSLAS